MFTTPKKATPKRPHPYHTPTRASPGGRMQPPPPATPCTTSCFADAPRPMTPSPRNFVLRGTPAKTPHRVEGNFRGHTQSPRRQPNSPARSSALPVHLQANPTLDVIIEETSNAMHNARGPLSKEELIYFAELERLGMAHKFNNALAGAREVADRGAKEGPSLNAEIDARAQVRYPTKSKILEQRRKERAMRELARKRSFELRVQRELEEERGQARQKLADKKRRRAEREKLAQTEAKVAPTTGQRRESSAGSTTTTLVPDSSSTHEPMDASTSPPISEQQEDAEGARQAAEAEAAMRTQVKEAQAQFEAQQEQARILAYQAEEERKRIEEARFAAEMERSQAAKAARRAAEELERAIREHAIAEEQRQRAQEATRLAEEELRQSEQERLRAQHEEEERLRAIQEAERAFLQWKAEQEARMREEYLNVEQRQAELKRIIEENTMSYTHQLLLQAELERLQTELLAAQRAQEECYRQQQQFQQEQEQYQRKQQQYQQEQQQHYQQQESYSQQPDPNAYHHAPEQDSPMRDSSFMNASRNPEDYPPYNNSEETSSSAPSPEAPPPVRPTSTQLYATWKAKWKEMDSRTDLSDVHFSELPWPVFCPVNSMKDITTESVSEFINDEARPSGLSFKRLVAHYHSDRFEHRVKRKMHPDQHDIVDEIAKQCTITLVNLLR